MKMWQVDVAYTGYVSAEVEAETEEEAIEQVEAMGTSGISNLMRWEEADMVEELSDEPQEGDYILADNPRGGYVVSICGGQRINGKPSFSLMDRDEAERAIRRDVVNADVFPDVWFQSDHGNLELLDFKW